MSNILITICGRAGSKGFANKNLKVFCGKPLVYYTLCTAFNFAKTHATDNVDIALNTDSEPLISLATDAYKEVFVLRRASELCGDSVPKMAVFQDSLARMEAQQGIIYDYVIDLDITSPLRTFADLQNAFEQKCARHDLDLVLSVTNSRRNPYFNMVRENGDHIEKGVTGETFTARQQAPVLYDVNASLYVFSRNFLANNTTGNLWDGKLGMSLMMDTGVLDIDSEEDFVLMEVIAAHLYAKYPQFAAVRDNIRQVLK